MQPQRWRGEGVARLGPTRRERRIRAYTPTVDRLSDRARSVRVPAVMTLVLIAIALVTIVVATALVGLALARSEALTDIDHVGRDIAAEDVRECRERREDLDDAARSYRSRTGDRPTDIDDIAPGTRDFVIDGGGDPIPAPGSRCEGVADDVTGAGQAVADRAEAAWAEVAGAVALGLIILAVLAVLAVPGMLSWWLYTAYQGLPAAAQHVRPRKAFSILTTFAVTYPVVLTSIVLIAAYVVDESLLTANIMAGVVQLVGTLVMLRAVLVVVDMIGDVTFEFSHHHYGTSRAMRLSAVGYALLPYLVTSIVTVGALVVEESLALTILVILMVVILVIWAVCPVVFAVSLVVAVWKATRGIERTLEEAAEEIAAAEALVRTMSSEPQPLGV
jgi:hypothetical protein